MGLDDISSGGWKSAVQDRASGKCGVAHSVATAYGWSMSTIHRNRQLFQYATHVFGSHEEALLWFRKPAIGLEQRRPIDLLWTIAGIERVETLLRQIDQGVYV